MCRKNNTIYFVIHNFIMGVWRVQYSEGFERKSITRNRRERRVFSTTILIGKARMQRKHIRDNRVNDANGPSGPGADSEISVENADWRLINN